MKLWAPSLAVFVVVAMLSSPGAAAAVADPPTIANESVSNLTQTDAILEAEINPQSMERGAWYQFQIATSPTAFASEFTCPTEGFPAHSSLCLTVPSQPGALPLSGLSPGTEATPVSLDLAGAGRELQPGVTYYWRVIAAGAVPTIDTIEWEKPAVHGAAMSFETPAPGSAPTIESESVSAITETNATLEAAIDSGGLPTSYEFHLWRRWKCELGGCEPPISSVPLPGGELPASASAQPVSLDLNSAGVYLYSPNFYEYWVTATNSAGSAEGPVITFASEEAGSGGVEWKPPGEWEQEPVPTPAQHDPASAEGQRGGSRPRRGCAARRKPHHPHRRGLHRACVAPV